MLENTSTHHIVLMLGRDHVDIAPVALRKLWIAVLEVRALRHKPKLEDISLRYVVAKCSALLVCWGRAQ